MLVERQAELDRISAVLAGARAGTGARLLISGPLGNGKSALLHEIPSLQAADGMRVMHANASSLEQDFSFGVVRQLFDSVFEEGIPDEFAPRALVGTLREVSADQPSLLLVDDLQWCDEPSLRWLDRLTGHLHSMRVLLVTAVRVGDSRTIAMIAAGGDELRPEPLSRTGTADLVCKYTGEWPADEFVVACHEVTGGNPMFLMSLLLNLGYRGLVPAASHVDAVRSLRPPQLQERLVRCLQTQSDDVRALARAAAVLGGRGDAELVRQLAGLDAVGFETAARTLCHLGLVRDHRSPRFTHLAVRDAVEDWLNAAEREDLHLRAVKLLHDNGCPAEDVAVRLMTVTSRHDQWAIDVLRSAAGIALRRGVPEVAARYLRRALTDIASDSEDRALLLVELAGAERGFDANASMRHISYAVPLLQTVRARAAAVARIPPSMLVGAPRSVRDLIERVAGEFGDLEGLTGIDRELGLCLEARLRYSWHSDPGQLEDSVRRLRALPDLGDTDAERELLVVLLDAAMLTAGIPADEVARLGRRVLGHEPATPADVHTALPRLATCMAAADAVADLVPWLDLALDAVGMREGTVEHSVIRAEQAVVQLHMGQLYEAGSAAHDALALMAVDSRATRSVASVGLVGVALELRERRLITKLLDLQHDRSEQAGLATVHRMLHGSAAAMSGDLERALRHHLECGRVLESAGWRNPVLLPWRLAAASLYARTGDLDAATELAEEAHSRAVEWNAPSGIGRALRMLSRLTPGRRGMGLVRESVDVLAASCSTFELAKSLLELGVRERAAGERDAAQHLRHAHELALAGGAGRVAARCAEELATLDSSDSRPVLTKSEYKVASLAVDGFSNQQIADILQVSRRAVEKHLTHSFRKLGIRRRTELSSAMVYPRPEA